MAGVANKVKYTEVNHHQQGRTGGGPRSNTKTGPASGNIRKNPTKSGGINRGTKGKMAQRG